MRDAHPAAADRRAARHELVVLVLTLTAIARLLDGPLLWPVAGLTLLVGLLGTRAALRVGESRHVPVESLLLPAVGAAAVLGAVRLVPLEPLGLWLLPTLFAAAAGLDRILVLEERLRAATGGPTGDDRTVVLAWALLVGFLGFVGAAALVPNGLVEPLPAGAPGGPAPLSVEWMTILAAADALVAGMLGYRVVALRVAGVRRRLLSATTFAPIAAIGAGSIRALAIPRLLGPALLTLLFFLWDAFHPAPARRRDLRWLWEVALLTVLALAVVALNRQLGA